MSKKILNWKVEELNSREDVEKLPDDIQGVYIMENVLLEIFYVGKTEKQGIQKRIDQHYGTQEKNEVIIHNLKKEWPIDLYYAEVSEEEIPGIEQFLKDYFQPKGNTNEPCLDQSIECSLPFQIEKSIALGLYK